MILEVMFLTGFVHLRSLVEYYNMMSFIRPGE